MTLHHHFISCAMGDYKNLILTNIPGPILLHQKDTDCIWCYAQSWRRLEYKGTFLPLLLMKVPADSARLDSLRQYMKASSVLS